MTCGSNFDSHRTFPAGSGVGELLSLSCLSFSAMFGLNNMEGSLERDCWYRSLANALAFWLYSGGSVIRSACVDRSSGF